MLSKERPVQPKADFKKWEKLKKKKNEWSIDTQYNVDEPWKHYAQWKKQVTKTTYYMILFIYKIYTLLPETSANRKQQKVVAV